MRNSELGKTTEQLGDFRVAFFNRERTIVDAFRYLSIEVAIKALKAAFAPGATHKLDIRLLRRYAKALRVKIEPYLMVVIA